jgi:hypothetical protein
MVTQFSLQRRYLRVKCIFFPQSIFKSMDVEGGTKQGANGNNLAVPTKNIFSRNF